MQENLLAMMEQFGYLAMFLLITLENLLPPIPSEVILLFGGVLTAQMDLTLGGMLLAATAGSLAGAVALYEIGAELPVQKLDSLLGRLGFKKGDLERALAWFRRYDRRAVFLCRFVPVVRSLISIPAGMERMPLARFLCYTAAGSTVWNLVLLNLGRLAGDSWGTVLEWLDRYSHAFWALAAVVLLYQLAKRRAERTKQKAERTKGVAKREGSVL